MDPFYHRLLIGRDDNSAMLLADMEDPLPAHSSSVASPGSQDSAPMDESESESDNYQPAAANGKMSNDDDTNYPIDGIYASEAEREDILAMPELVREQLLAKRQEEVDRQRQNALLRRLLKTKPDDAQSTKKRKASSTDIDDQRKTSRQRTRVGGSKVGETSAGIESLRRARAEKSDRLRRREEDRERKRTSYSASRDSPDRDNRGHSDRVDDRRTRSRTPEVKEALPADLRDFERVRVGRSRFAQVCFYPEFNERITNCYVRIAVGPGSKKDEEPTYRMAVIKGMIKGTTLLALLYFTHHSFAGFKTGKAYAMEKKSGHFVTDQYIVAAHGKAERDWPFFSCSDKPFTEVCYVIFPSPHFHSPLIKSRPSSTVTRGSAKKRVSLSQRSPI